MSERCGVLVLARLVTDFLGPESSEELPGLIRAKIASDSVSVREQ